MFKSNGFKLCIGLLLGVIVYLLPRPEGTIFEVTGDEGKLTAMLSLLKPIGIKEIAKTGIIALYREPK